GRQPTAGGRLLVPRRQRRRGRPTGHGREDDGDPGQGRRDPPPIVRGRWRRRRPERPAALRLPDASRRDRPGGRLRPGRPGRPRRLDDRVWVSPWTAVVGGRRPGARAV
ncbi:MAG: hypothetical protein AVDCRST_MAG49-2154, partial [uncultured Thermomicrobiales bacterium]